ncbi:hypothetical protein ISS04_03555 [Candidatus Woesearchaeota archaeon]|nr:hypothetical protein [Candidatus Woesearchaeota archaeon]
MAKLSTNRFGARYGAKLRKKLAVIEKQQKKSYKCPYCNYDKVKRVFVGVWYCKKCDAKFTSKAYSVGKVEIKSIEEKVEEKVEKKVLKKVEKGKSSIKKITKKLSTKKEGNKKSSSEIKEDE